MEESEWTLKDVSDLLGGLRNGVDEALPLALVLDTKCTEKELLPLTYEDFNFKTGELKISKILEKNEVTNTYEVIPKKGKDIRTIKLDNYTAELIKKSYAKYKRQKRKQLNFIDSRCIFHNKDGRLKNFFLPS